MSKRYSALAAALYLSALPIVQGFDGVPDTAAPAATPSAPAATSPSTASGDAAAKHAKRTACLKEAKTKKLVGAARTSFVKNCVAAP
jgi:type IV secretory pathway VirJ component